MCIVWPMMEQLRNMLTAEGEYSPDAKVSSSNKNASGGKEAASASDSSENDAEDCGVKDSAGQNSDNDDSESSLMKMISELMKSKMKNQAAKVVSLEREREQDAKDVTEIKLIVSSSTVLDS